MRAGMLLPKGVASLWVFTGLRVLGFRFWVIRYATMHEGRRTALEPPDLKAKNQEQKADG